MSRCQFNVVYSAVNTFASADILFIKFVKVTQQINHNKRPSFSCLTFHLDQKFLLLASCAKLMLTKSQIKILLFS